MSTVRTVVSLLVLALLGPAVLVTALTLGQEASAPSANPRPPVLATTLLTEQVVPPVPLPALDRASRGLPRRPAPTRPGSVLVSPPAARVVRAPARAAGTGYTITDAIADCESGERLANGRAVHGSYNVHGEDPNSTASGKWSFIDSTWRDASGLPGHASDYSEAVQDRAFRRLWDDGRGASHWAASRSCWGWAL